MQPGNLNWTAALSWREEIALGQDIVGGRLKRWRNAGRNAAARRHKRAGEKRGRVWVSLA